MFGQIIRGTVVTFICILVFGITLEIARAIIGSTFSEHGLFALVIPMGVISWIASYGREETSLAFEIPLIFIVIWFAMIFANVGSPLLLLILFGGYIALYAKPFLVGCNYVFVRAPLECDAEKQATLSEKLDADAELAEAVLRHERARSALADAELAVREAEEARGGVRQ
jgi:hypothetical protein